MISTRYVWPVVALLAFAFVPTVLNVYAEPEPLREGVLAQSIPERIDGFRGPTPGKRSASWTERNFGARDFVTRGYVGASGTKYALYATRSYDAKKLFHFPELALTYGRAESERRFTEIRTSAGTIPVHLIEFDTADGRHRAMYVLLYGDRGVKQPIPFMLARIPELFVGKREAMTLIYVQGGGAAPERLEEELKQLLAGACEKQ